MALNLKTEKAEIAKASLCDLSVLTVVLIHVASGGLTVDLEIKLRDPTRGQKTDCFQPQSRPVQDNTFYPAARNCDLVHPFEAYISWPFQKDR